MSTVTREDVIAHIHRRAEFDHGECDHGIYMSSAPHNGQPYKMCERKADALIAAFPHLIGEVCESGLYNSDDFTATRQDYTVTGPWREVEG